MKKYKLLKDYSTPHQYYPAGTILTGFSHGGRVYYNMSESKEYGFQGISFPELDILKHPDWFAPVDDAPKPPKHKSYRTRIPFADRLVYVPTGSIITYGTGNLYWFGDCAGTYTFPADMVEQRPEWFTPVVENDEMTVVECFATKDKVYTFYAPRKFKIGYAYPSPGQTNIYIFP